MKQKIIIFCLGVLALGGCVHSEMKEEFRNPASNRGKEKTFDLSTQMLTVEFRGRESTFAIPAYLTVLEIHDRRGVTLKHPLRGQLEILGPPTDPGILKRDVVIADRSVNPPLQYVVAAGPKSKVSFHGTPDQISRLYLVSDQS